MKRGFANTSLLLVLLASVFGMVVASATSSINLPFVMASTDGGEGEGGGDESGGEGGGEEEEGGEGPEPEPEPKPEPEPEPEPVPLPEPIIEPIVPEPEPIDCPEGFVVSDIDTCVPAPNAKTAVQQPQLPLCNGTPRDCITPGGDICLQGQAIYECECAEDVSDCPKHPSLQEPPPEPPKKPLPYCDKVEDDHNYDGPCHDRKDFSDDTGLYPCNDGTEKEDWRDCEDAYVPLPPTPGPSPKPKPCDPKTDENCNPPCKPCDAGPGAHCPAVCIPFERPRCRSFRQAIFRCRDVFYFSA